MGSKRWGFSTFAVAFVVAAAIPAAAQATTWTVNTTNDATAPGCVGNGQCSIRQALAASAAGDTIVVPAGDYVLSDGELVMAEPVTIDGAGAATTTINANGASRVMEITSNLSAPTTLSGLTLTGGAVTAAGPSEGGGGLRVDDTYSGLITIDGSNITNNHITIDSLSNNGGAGIDDLADSDLTLNDSTVNSNVATLTGSESNSGGGGIYNNDGTVTLNASAVNSNTVQQGIGASSNDGGGGIYQDGEDVTLTDGSTVNGNSETIDDGTSNDGGGGIYQDGNDVTVTNSSVDTNTLTLSGNTASNNGGGGIYNDGANTTLTSSSINGNTASISGTGELGGGGVYTDAGELSLTSSTIADNSATISNTSGFDGGGAVFDDGATSSYLNSTLSGNSVTINTLTAPVGGGAIFHNSLEAGSFSDTTIADNETNGSGGGLFNAGHQYTLKNTIVAANTATPTGNCAASGANLFTSDGGNVESTDTCLLTAATDQTNTQPDLGALGDNGGPTFTQLPAVGSPVINAGSCTDTSGSPVTTDQRGEPRPASGAPAGKCDSGAVEVQRPANTAPPVITGTPAAGDTLTCSTGSWANSPTAFAYQWNRSGQPISGATANTYVVQQTDAGQTITCTVTASNAYGAGSPATSAGVAVAASGAQPPGNTSPPQITGSPQPPDTLTCQHGAWSNDPTGYTYQWNLNGTPISGATSSTYVVQFADEAQTLTCTVTAINAGGTGKPATSAGAFVGNTHELNCAKPSGTLSGKRIGPLALGMTKAHAEHVLPRYGKLGYGFVNFCLYAGWGIRAAFPSATLLTSLPGVERSNVKGRIVIELTANPFYKLHGIVPGMQLTAAQKLLRFAKPYHIGRNIWYLAPDGPATAVLKVRHGLILEIGLANKQLTSGPRSRQRKFMSSFNE